MVSVQLPTSLTGPIEAVINPKREPEWYAVQTYAGREDSACRHLLERVEAFNAKDYILDVRVPKQTVVKVTDKGEQKEEQETMYAGYLLVQIRMPESRSFVPINRLSFMDGSMKENKGSVDPLEVVRDTPGIINFISLEAEHDGLRLPIPLSKEDSDLMIRGGGDDEGRINFGFEVGDVVMINDGPFNEFSGTVDEVQFEKGTVRVTVSFFGQDTPVELPFTSVERA